MLEHSRTNPKTSRGDEVAVDGGLDRLDHLVHGEIRDGLSLQRWPGVDPC